MSEANKQLVWRYWQMLNEAKSGDAAAPFLHPNVIWHGFQPLRHLQGVAQIIDQFWTPLLRAVPDLMRRPYILIGGHYSDPKFGTGDWVAGTGDFIGTFAQDWHLGNYKIPASGRSVHMRFGEFCMIEAGRIAEIRLLVDLPNLMRQAGIDLLPSNYGRELWIPGPVQGDGICLAEQDPAETEKTYRLVTNMIFGGLNKYDGRSQDSQGLEQFWHDQMVWHGPAGIGSAYGLEEFKRNAQGPIVWAFPDRRGAGHQARIADGYFAASTGWPSLVGTHLNPYMDWPPTGVRIGWNIMDFWKREEEKLLENWVMIDLIDAARASGIDLLDSI